MSSSRLGALADQAKDSLAQVGATSAASNTIDADVPDPEIPDTEVPNLELDSDVDVDVVSSEAMSEGFDAADLGDLIESDLEDLDSIAATEIVTPEAAGSDDVDVDLAAAMDIDWAETTGIELPDTSIEPPEVMDLNLGDEDRPGFIESFDTAEEPVAMPIDDLVEDQAVSDLIALDDIAIDETDGAPIELDDVPDEDGSRPAGLGLSAAAVAGSAAVAKIVGDDGEPVSELENLDGDIQASAATRTYTSVPKPKPKVDNDLNELFIEANTPDAEPKRSYSLLILVLLALAVLLLLWVMSDDSDDSGTNTTDATATSVQPGDEDTSTVTTAEPAPASTEAATTAAPTTVPEPTIPPTVWNLVGVESGTSQFTELGAPLGLQAALEQTVDADGNPLEFTLFAPSDEAISALTQAQRDALAQDVTAAEQLIDYHFVDQRLTQELLLEASGGELMTRAGLPIFVDTEGGDIVLNGTTRIALTEFEAGNGNVLVVDTVLQQPTINTVLNLGNIQFEVISSVITDAGKAELQKAVDYFNENPDANALIEGHTDTDGDADANLRLSDRRARAVREFLIEQGIDGSRLVARGFGESEPILIDGVEDKNASRRIEFTLQ